MNNKTTFTEKNFCSSSSAGQVKCSLINRAETFSPIFWKKMAGSQKRSVRTYIYFSFKKVVFFSKCSLGHPDCIFDEQAAYLPPEVRYSFADKVQN